jgi:tetratricopeptide (TPR) repeat protein
LHLRGRAEAELGDPDAAVTTYETALRLEPQQDDWRYEYADLLRQKGRLKDALNELRTVVGRRPGHRKAQELLQRIARELAEQG